MRKKESIGESLCVLEKEVERLKTLGCPVAVSLLQIAGVELQIRLHDVTENEIEALACLAIAVQQKRYARQNGRRAPG